MVAGVLCLFAFAPTSRTDGADVRRRRLIEQLGQLGSTRAVVLTAMDEAGREQLAGELAIPVLALGVPRRNRAAALASWLVHPSVPWGIARIDGVVARARLVAELGGDAPDLVWCAGLDAWRVLPRAWRRRSVIDVVDLPSRWSRELARVAVRRRVRRTVHDRGPDPTFLVTVRDVMFHVDGMIRYRWLQRAAARRSIAVVVANPHEAAGRRGVRCVPTGVVDPGAVPAEAPADAPSRFVFAGSFHNPPNLDGAEWFVDHVLGPLDRLVPSAQFVFAGSCPPDFPAFGLRNGIEVTGYLDELADAFDATSVAIVPVRTGSGTGVKVVEAWARGVPVVSTHKAIEGLDAVDGQEVLVADDPAEFAAACSQVARSPELRRVLVAGGRARFVGEYTWDRIGRDLRAWLAPVLAP